MSEVSKREDEWQAKATAVAIAEARKVATSDGPLMNTPVGRLSDLEWGWIVGGVVFGWITTRHQQAISEGWDHEETTGKGVGRTSPAGGYSRGADRAALLVSRASTWRLPDPRRSVRDVR